MEGEFTNFCKRYYELLQNWDKLEDRYEALVENMIPYTKQTDVGELDTILRCHRRIKKARDAADSCIADLQQTEDILKQILAYFEIEPNIKPKCEIPGSFELELWLDDEQGVNCIKTHDLSPLEDDENIITIPCADTRNNWEDDDDEE